MTPEELFESYSKQDDPNITHETNFIGALNSFLGVSRRLLLFHGTPSKSQEGKYHSH